MSEEEEEELENIRRRRMAQLRQQQASQQIAEAQQKEYEAKKFQVMRKILSPEARQRLENIRMVKPEFAEQIEIQMIQLFQAGRLRGATPLPDNAFKNLLEQITKSMNKKEFKIKKF